MKLTEFKNNENTENKLEMTRKLFFDGNIFECYHHGCIWAGNAGFLAGKI